jgi:hypothetical protein
MITGTSLREYLTSTAPSQNALNIRVDGFCHTATATARKWVIDCQATCLSCQLPLSDKCATCPDTGTPYLVRDTGECVSSCTRQTN